MIWHFTASRSWRESVCWSIHSASPCSVCVQVRFYECSRVLLVSFLTSWKGPPLHCTTGCVSTEAGTPASCSPLSQLVLLPDVGNLALRLFLFPCGDHVCPSTRKSVGTSRLFYKWDVTHVKKSKSLFPAWARSHSCTFSRCLRFFAGHVCIPTCHWGHGLCLTIAEGHAYGTGHIGQHIRVSISDSHSNGFLYCICATQ